MYVVLAPTSWNANETYIGDAKSFRQWIYWNPNNIGDAIRNLILSCEAFGHVVRSTPDLADDQVWSGRLAAVETALKSFN